MGSLWFVTPAHDRIEIADVVFEQRRRVCDQTGAQCVVIAEDGNLELAEKYGFHRLERPHHPLGAKVNDGYEFAFLGGADFVCPLGNDTWINPDWLGCLDEEAFWVTTTGKWCVAATPWDLSLLYVEDQWNPYGAGPFIVPRFGGRPVPEENEDGIDRSTVMGAGLPCRWRFMPYSQVSWKSAVSLTPLESLRHLEVMSTPRVAEYLCRSFPPDLVSRMRGAYGL